VGSERKRKGGKAKPSHVGENPTKFPFNGLAKPLSWGVAWKNRTWVRGKKEKPVAKKATSGQGERKPLA